jgi:methionine--tRNA ligase beta chain
LYETKEERKVRVVQSTMDPLSHYLYGDSRGLFVYDGGISMTQPTKNQITFDDLEKIDIRVGTIVAVDDVPESDKLIRLTVDLGEDRFRTILVGMKKERKDPKGEIEGKQALFAVNLPPRKMAGIVSEGMLFDIGYADGIIPVLALPEKPVPNGTRVG